MHIPIVAMPCNNNTIAKIMYKKPGIIPAAKYLAGTRPITRDMAHAAYSSLTSVTGATYRLPPPIA